MKYSKISGSHVILLLGFIVGGIASSVILGWLTKTEVLINLTPGFQPDYTPMVFNTALCFFLCAIVTLLFVLDKFKYVTPLALTMFIISGLSSLEYLLQISFGIDQLFIDDFVQAETSAYPGRMAPNTAVAFLLTSIVLLFKNTNIQKYQALQRFISCIILGISCVAFMGYLFGVPTAYGWNAITAMALLTSVNFMLISLALLLHFRKKVANLKSFTAPMLIFILFVSAILWQALTALNQQTNINNSTPNLILLAGLICSLGLIYYSYSRSKTDAYHIDKYMSLVILSLGTISSISLYSYLSQSEDLRIEEKFKNKALGHATTISSTINTLTTLLNTSRSIAYFNTEDTHELFNIMSTLFLSEYSTIKSFSWVPVVTDRVNFEQQLQKNYNINIGISERVNKENITASEQHIYTPIMYEYPENNIHKNIGVNLYSDPFYKELFNQSYYKESPSQYFFTSKTNQDNGKASAIVSIPIKKSIFQKQAQIKTISDIRGFILIHYDIAEFIEKIIRRSLTPGGLHLYFQENNNEENNYLHVSRLNTDKEVNIKTLNQGLSTSFPLTIVNTDLTLTLWPSDSFIIERSSKMPEMLALLLFFSVIIISIYQYASSLRAKKIAEIKSHLSAIFETLPNAIIVSDQEGNIVDCNNEFARIVDIEKEKINKKNFQGNLEQIIGMEQVKEENLALFKTGGKCISEIQLAFNDGEKHIYNYERRIIQTNEGNQLLGTLSDLTHEKKIAQDLSHALQISGEIFNSAPDAMLIVDEAGKIIKLNAPAQKLFGYTTHELLNQSIEILVPQRVHTHHKQLREAFTTQNRSRAMGSDMMILAVHKDGSEIPVEISLSTIFVEGNKQILTSIRDVSERNTNEKALRKAKEEAESANTAKSDFLANMSHEIRTPMNAILGFSNLILESHLNNEQESYINKIKKSANSLLSIINDILDFSKIEEKEIHLELSSFNLYVDVLEHLSNILSHKVEAKHLEIIFDFDTRLPTNIIGDPLRLGQVLLNLLNNAVKFTKEGEIYFIIQVVALEKNNVTLKFEIIDTGIGMSVEQINALFKPFTQADSSTTRSYGGTGLGLSIVQELVNLMGSKVIVTSTLGKGASFSFNVEFELGNVASPIEPHIEKSQHRMLIVDDNARSLSTIKKYAEHLGYHVETEQEPEAAIEKLKAHSHCPFDLIITDWNMPKMNGIAFLKAIQQESHLKQVPTIVISAFNPDFNQAQDPNVIISEVMQKPIMLPRLQSAITNALNIKQVDNITYSTPDKISLTDVNILLVDDNEISQELGEEILHMVGANVTIAENGQVAINKLAESTFEIVLMDIQMPILDGISATKIIRSNPQYKALPIIAMTGNSLAKEKEEALASGMNSYINKPMNAQDLYQKIWALLPVHIGKGKKQSSLSHVSDREQRFLDALLNCGLESYQALSRLDNNHSLYLSIISKFIKGLPERTSTIESKLITQDKDSLKAEFHALKGLLGNIGAIDIAGKCAKIETQLVASEFPIAGIRTLLSALNTLHTSVNQLIFTTNKVTKEQQETANSAESQATPLSAEEIEHSTLKLERFLCDNDTEAIELLEDLIRNNVEPTSVLKSMLASCEQYKFDDAAKLLTQLKPSSIGG